MHAGQHIILCDCWSWAAQWGPCGWRWGHCNSTWVCDAVCNRIISYLFVLQTLFHTITIALCFCHHFCCFSLCDTCRHIAHILLLIGKYLNLPLRFPIKLLASRSVIRVCLPCHVRSNTYQRKGLFFWWKFDVTLHLRSNQCAIVFLMLSLVLISNVVCFSGWYLPWTSR